MSFAGAAFLGAPISCDTSQGSMALSSAFILGFRARPLCHADALEFVTSPKCPVIQIAAWLAFFHELARIKNPVVGLKP